MPMVGHGRQKCILYFPVLLQSVEMNLDPNGMAFYTFHPYSQVTWEKQA
uniref:Uncharacterized protein n=1 Tax=Tetranychus urticae TaxID=32264 RepID=T1KHD0_TETUR